MRNPDPNAHSESHPVGSAPADVARWAATVPPGTTGRASELLEAFLEAGGAPWSPFAARWSSVSFGMALTRLVGLQPYGITRVMDRKCVSVFSFAGPR